MSLGMRKQGVEITGVGGGAVSCPNAHSKGLNLNLILTMTYRGIMGHPEFIDYQSRSGNNATTLRLTFLG